MTTNEECKLSGPTDWERWRRQFQLTARAADLWDIVQGLEDPIRKPAEPNINSYPRSAATAPPAQTRSQSQAADDSHSTVQQELQSGPVKFAHLMNADQKFFIAVISIYENKLKVYNI